MTRDELIEKVAIIIFHNEFKECDSNETAEEILNTIFEALKEPTNEMWGNLNIMGSRGLCLNIWQAMLAASPLAPEEKK